MKKFKLNKILALFSVIGLVSFSTNLAFSNENTFDISSAFKKENSTDHLSNDKNHHNDIISKSYNTEEENISILFDKKYSSNQSTIDPLNPYEHQNSEPIDISNGDIEISNEIEIENEVLFVNNYSKEKWILAIQSTPTNYDLIKQFFNHGFNINSSVFDDGNNMLILAAMQNREELLDFALENKANLTQTNSQEQNVLHWASQQFNTNILNKILAQNKSIDFINKADKLGRTPLHNATLKDSIANVNTLIKNGANVNALDKEGRTPLFYALKAHNYKAASLLLDNGALINMAENTQHPNLEPLILGSSIQMYELAFKHFSKDLQMQIIDSLKDAPQIIHALTNPNVTFEKFQNMEKFGIDVEEDIV